MNYTNPDEFWRHNDYDPYKDMSDDERLTTGCFQLTVMMLFIIFAFVICMLMGSCTTERVVTVEKVRMDTLRLSRNIHDSIYIHDSVSVWQKGDTMTIHEWHTKYVLNEKHDTTYIATHDTIPKPYPVIKEVERQMSRREKIIMSIGVMAIIGGMCWFVMFAVKILRQFGILKI